MKKWMHLLGTFVTILVVGWATAITAKAATQGFWEYMIYEGDAYVTKYLGMAENVTIPSQLGGYSVVGISSFGSNENVREIVIPNGVTGIYGGAFGYCGALEKVVIPASVNLLEKSAFYGCENLTDLRIDSKNPYFKCVDRSILTKDGTTLVICLHSNKGTYRVPDGVTTLKQYAFYNNVGITELILPVSLTTMEKNSICGCVDLTSLTIPKNVSSIAANAFVTLDKLETISVHSKNTTYKSVDGVMFSKDGKELFYVPDNRKGDYVVPQGVTAIGDYAFCDCDELTSVALPEGLKSIGIQAFHACTGLERMDLPESLTTIGSSAFLACRKLKYAKIPDGVTAFGICVFAYCNELTSVSLPGGLTSLPERTFDECFKLKIVALPESVTSIGSNAFRACRFLESLVLSGKLQSISKTAFTNCNPVRNVYYTGTSSEYQQLLTKLPAGNALCDAEVTLIVPNQLTLLGQTDHVYPREGEIYYYSVNAYGQGLTYQWQYWNGTKWCKATELGNQTPMLKGIYSADLNGRKYRCVITDANGKQIRSDSSLLTEKTLEEVLNTKGTKLTYVTSDRTPWISQRLDGKDCAVSTLKKNSVSESVLKTTVTLKQATEISFYFQAWGQNSNGQCTCVFAIDGVQEFKYGNMDNDWTPYSKIIPAGTHEITWSYIRNSSYVTPLGDYFAVAEVKLIQRDGLLFTEQPKDFEGYLGDEYQFQVALDKKNVSYQWQYSKDNGSTWEKMAQDSAKTATLTGKISDAVIGCLFRCRAYDKDGNDICSDAAKLTEGEPKIVKQPKSYYGTYGDTATFTVEAKGSNLTYQWQQYKDGAWIKSAREGAKTTTLTVPVTATTCGQKFRCAVKDRHGKVKYTNEVYVLEAEAKIMVQPPKYVACTPGKTFSVSIVADGNDLTYQWQQKLGNSEWRNTNLKGNQSATVKGTFKEEWVGFQLRCIITDRRGLKITSKVATLSKEISLDEALNVEGGNLHFETEGDRPWKGCFNGTEKAAYSGNTGLSSSTSAIVLHCVLTESADFSFDYIPGGRNVDVCEISVDGEVTLRRGYTGDWLTFSTKLYRGEHEIRWTFRKDAEVDSEIDEFVVKNVKFSKNVVYCPPVITKQPVDWEGLYGKKASFLVVATGKDLTYQWQYLKGGVWNDYAIETANTANLKVTMNEKNVKWPLRCVITDGNGFQVISDEVQMKYVGPATFEITKQPADWTGTYGKKASFSVEATGAGLTYQWQYRKGTTWNDYAIETANTANFKVTMNEKNAKWAYRCVITDASGNTLITNEVWMRLAEE